MILNVLLIANQSNRMFGLSSQRVYCNVRGVACKVYTPRAICYGQYVCKYARWIHNLHRGVITWAKQ